MHSKVDECTENAYLIKQGCQLNARERDRIWDAFKIETTKINNEFKIRVK